MEDYSTPVCIEQWCYKPRHDYNCAVWGKLQTIQTHSLVDYIKPIWLRILRLKVWRLIANTSSKLWEKLHKYVKVLNWKDGVYTSISHAWFYLSLHPQYSFHITYLSVTFCCVIVWSNDTKILWTLNHCWWTN